MKDEINYAEIGFQSILDQAKAMTQMASRIKDARFNEAIKMIAASGKIIVSGVGKSGNIAKKIAATMSSIGKPTVFIHPVDALHGDLGLISENDSAMLLSKSGSTEEIVRLVPFIRSKGAKIISIVGNLDSFLARHSEIALDASVDREVCPLNLAPTTSTTAALVMGDALAVSVMTKLGTTKEDFARLHPLGQLGRNITLKVKDIMHFGQDLPAAEDDISFADALIIISEKKLGCVCITHEGNLIGLITDGDVRRIIQKNPDLSGLAVAEVMTKNPISIRSEAFLGEALSLMEQRESQISVLPVTSDGGKLVGVVRLHDIIRSGI